MELPENTTHHFYYDFITQMYPSPPFCPSSSWRRIIPELNTEKELRSLETTCSCFDMLRHDSKIWKDLYNSANDLSNFIEDDNREEPITNMETDSWQFRGQWKKQN